MNVATAFAAQWLVVVPALLVVTAIVVRRNWKWDLIEAFVAGLAAVALVKIAGTFFVEPRPFVAEHVQPLVAHAADNAFPSDHLAACGLAFMYLLVRSRAMAAAVLLLAGAIAYARVAAHLHWPLDVAVGFVLGMLAALLARFSVQRLAGKASEGPASHRRP
ncbi:MAG TPA: phosphatase PAP2 family protein [Candidatus Baltobacteraceae bacterium]|nr:phosphatase PAP2 family protein [Candidatus Baltobacteraceae bacterium]